MAHDSPKLVLEPKFPLLDAVLWWALPAPALLAGVWTAAATTVDVVDGASDPAAMITCGIAAAVALFGGMSVFERLLGAAGEALGAGVTFQLIQSPFIEHGIIPGWSMPVGGSSLRS
ncbi:hypothetical protein [Pseudonocardia adelaidensis]|uniref:hypothetical protein n=1 Tax=Pseudonocardia adelaidensis TaxID=648754 RepID=UPI0031F12FE5